MNLKNLVPCAILVSLLSTASLAEEIAVGCALRESAGAPEVVFSGVQGDVEPKNFNSSGLISVTARIMALDGSVFVASRSLTYSLVGARVEFVLPGWEPLVIPVTMEEFRAQFGLFPTITCVTP